MNPSWTGGNRVELLENGEAFFPRVLADIRAAREDVLIETFILFDDKVGRQLHAALVDAARRGVRVELTVDGYGSPDLPPDFVDALAAAGVKLRVFDPKPRLLGMRTNLFRRMHRKIAVMDGRVAFVGGINFSADHLGDFGPQAKQDYAVRIEGPAVGPIRAFALAAIEDPAAPPIWRYTEAPAAPPTGGDGAQVMLVARDNARHPTDIERAYLAAIDAAREQVVIANAYFLPGYRLLRALRHAARRGVRVELILQGMPDMPWVMKAARQLYPHLLDAGVRIFEYHRRPLHGKLAVVDDEWATVGSSNLDPLSLSLNLEANVLVRDRAFGTHVRQRLQRLMAQHCRRIVAEQLPGKRAWRALTGLLAYHVLRHLPAWAGLWPAHTPKIAVVRLDREDRADREDRR